MDGGGVESSRGEDIVANKEPEKKIQTDTHQDDNEEIGIEINVDKSEKDEFYVHEEEQEKQADLSTKEEVKQEKKVCNCINAFYIIKGLQLQIPLYSIY